MLTLALIDSTAESRQRLASRLDSFVSQPASDIEYLPRINFQPLAPEELRFHARPDVAIVGVELLRREITELRRIREQLPDVPLIAWPGAEQQDLAGVEQLARLGADDVFPTDISAADFLRKCLLLARRRRTASGGKLILVLGAKGGVGVTSIAAALGEIAACTGQRTLLIDTDAESQDASRFLSVRPFVNENLQLLLDSQRPLTQEFVEQCYLPVWEEEMGLACMTPPVDVDCMYDSRSAAPRIFHGLLEILDALQDVIVVDGGGLRGAMLRTFARVADQVLFVTSNDAASLFASVDGVRRIRALMACDAELRVLVNTLRSEGLSPRVVESEFSRAAQLAAGQWLRPGLSWCRRGFVWPGSGNTLFSLGSRRLRRELGELSSQLIGITPVAERSFIERFGDGLARMRRFAKPEVTAASSSRIDSREINHEPLQMGGARAAATPLLADTALARDMVVNGDAALVEETDEENIISTARFA